MPQIQAIEVFTPGDSPTVTYVNRDDAILARRLSEALDPRRDHSRSWDHRSPEDGADGRGLGGDDFITATGAALRLPGGFWERVLDWMDAPSALKESSERAPTPPQWW